MEGLKNFQQSVSILALVLMIFSINQVSGQISTACTGAMLRSFSPCINFITNGGNNNSPTTECCRSLKYVMSNGTDCLCLIVTGNVPFQVPINRTLAISLPKACNMAGGVPVQCKGPAESPRSSQRPMSPSSPSPEAANVPQPVTPTLGPVSDTTPDSPTDSFDYPDTNSGFKPDLTPSSAQSSMRCSVLFVLLAACGAMALRFY